MFAGELMKCCRCGFEQRSDPCIESGWWCAVGLDGRRRYVCPKCMGSEYALCHGCGRFFHPDYARCPWCGAGPDLVERGGPDAERMRRALEALARDAY